MIHDCGDMIFERFIQLSGSQGLVDPGRELASPEHDTFRAVTRQIRDNVRILPFKVMPPDFCANAFGKADNLVRGSEVERIRLWLYGLPFH